MIHTYPEIPQREIDYAGKTVMFCDAESCDAEAEVKTKTFKSDDDEKILRGEMPEGWVTSNPTNDPLQGAANFCSEHVHLQVEDAAPEEDVISDEGTSAVGTQQTGG